MRTLDLLRDRRFGPLFWTQFAGAFNDNFFKNALVALLVFRGGEPGAARSGLVHLSAAAFILPFFALSALAGQLADKLDKALWARRLKLAEVAVMGLGAVAFSTGSTWLSLFVLGAMGAQSALFGPLKYAVLPQQLNERELMLGNALVESATFAAILLGTLAGGWASQLGGLWVGGASMAVALLGYLASTRMPPVPASTPDLRLDPRPLRATAHLLRAARAQRPLWSCMLAISWFWALGALYLAELPELAKRTLGGDATTAGWLLVTFTLGVALGSFIVERMGKGRIELGAVPASALALGLAGLDLAFTVASPARAQSPRLWLDLLAVGAAGGAFVLPLYALLQQRSRAADRARMIAANNVLNALFMVAAAGFGILAAKLGLGVGQRFAVAAVLTAGVALVCLLRLKREALCLWVSALVRLLYRLRIEDLERIPASVPAVLVCNHVSYLDSFVIAAACPRPVRFVQDHRIRRTPVLRWLFQLARTIPIAPRSQDPATTERAFASIRQALDDGEVVCIFPEGRLTRDGQLGEFRAGVERILSERPVPVVPLGIDGLWGSFLSYRHGLPSRPRRFRARVRLRCGAALEASQASAAVLRARVDALRADPTCC